MGDPNPRSTETDSPRTHKLSEEERRVIDAYWRAANHLFVGQIYLLDNPVLPEPLRPEHVADNPGPWVLHCHNTYHAESGMLTVFSYMS